MGEEDDGYSGLHYCPMKSSGSGGAEKTTSSMTLLSSHLLSNGAVGDEQEIAQGMSTQFQIHVTTCTAVIISGEMGEGQRGLISLLY